MLADSHKQLKPLLVSPKVRFSFLRYLCEQYFLIAKLSTTKNNRRLQFSIPDHIGTTQLDLIRYVQGYLVSVFALLNAPT